MAEQTFRSPGFFEREIDVAPVVQGPTGTPAGVIGTSEKGPAFVPVTIGTFEDFRTRFGGVDPEKFGPYAVREFLKHRNSLTYLRVLGAGANDSLDDMNTTKSRGTVKNAGFALSSKSSNSSIDGRHQGAVQFIAARHYVSASESVTCPMFTDNGSFDTGNYTEPEYVNLIRGMIMTPSGTRVMVLDGSGQATPAKGSFATLNDTARIIRTGDNRGLFKIVLSSSDSSDFAADDSRKGIKILSASLNPSSPFYIANILNTDPSLFLKEQHLLYAHFPVDPEIANVAGGANDVGILSGSAKTSSDGGLTSTAMRDLYGRFDTRFTTPKTPAIISQPFGETEYDLFRFETISDGAWGNNKFKVSIRNLRKSDDPRNLYGSFTVEIRSFSDTDAAPQVIESYPNCNLNPKSERYVAAVIGDIKAYYNFDAEDEEERRIIVDGKYPNKSTSVRVVMNNAVEEGEVPASALPFGFRGMELLKTSDTLTDRSAALGSYGTAKAGPPATQKRRLAHTAQCGLSGSILPPIPFRFKVTKGQYDNTNDDGVPGKPGKNEVADSKFYWGVKFERNPETGSIANAAFKPNNGSKRNELIENYTKFMGVNKLDLFVTGTSADKFCDNKFTLAKVAFGNFVGASQKVTTVLVSNFTASAGQHMRDAAYLRDGAPDSSNYLIKDSASKQRVTLGTLVNLTSSVYFNRFSGWAKFSTFFYGGWDGLNILDVNAKKMNDRSASTDTNGGANGSFVSPGLVDTSGNAKNVGGTGKDNNAVASYRTAVKIMTDEMTVNTNILAIPGIRDAFITDYAAQRARDYSMLFYLMDLIEYDEDGNRLFDDSTAKPDVQKTSEEFSGRSVDNNYSATYFPDIFIDDPYNRRQVKVPPSVAAIAALAYNDKVAYPWFAPAGFNRAALDMVSNVDVRLNAGDRDELYDARINPIATFPREGYVIFGQKTLQASKSALDRVNVRRLMLEVKRIVVGIANRFVFEQNTPETRSRFVGQVVPLLALVQAQAGIEKFSVVMDATNNTDEDVSANRLNGKIVVVPTRTVEFIAVDFIVDTTGASFV
jgi:hypothetical protein